MSVLVLNFSEMDKVLVQLTQDFMADDRLIDLAKNNPQSTFERIFEQQFKDIAALRYEQNEEFLSECSRMKSLWLRS
jgi:type I restriction enzyme R subunit